MKKLLRISRARTAGLSSLGRVASLALPLLLVFMATGCSTFNRDWKRAGAAPADDIQGRWEGTWANQNNSHHGTVRCIMTQVSTATYEARFHATFWKIFHSGYTVPLAAAKLGDVWKLQGETDLGWLAGGLYRYDGQATAANFSCTYTSSCFQGTFQMNRPGIAAPEHAAKPENGTAAK